MKSFLRNLFFQKGMNFPKLRSRAVLSPMAGVTDVAFRALCKEFGVGMTYTEFVSSAAIVRGNTSSLNLLKTDPSENPVAVQLFGSSIQEVVAAAQAVEDQFDVIDINCGCPAWKVIKTGAGSEMLKKPEEIGRFVNKIASAISKPVTVKIRAGIDEHLINAIEIAKIVEDSGAAALAIHGRTQKQGYRGEADWNIIKQVKESISIPVIGNGDVFTPEVFKKRLEESGVDAIMIARGAMNNPYIFRQISEYLETGSYTLPPTNIFLKYLSYAKKHNIDFETIKRHAMSFTKGTEGGASIRENIAKTKNKEELCALFST
jgi:tRNA-dihydrouridine synthase B